MNLGYDLTIEQSQKLVMTPELIQAIQILQFTNQELNDYVQEQLLANPVLENASLTPGTGEEEGTIRDSVNLAQPEKHEEGEDHEDHGQPSRSSSEKEKSGLDEADWREQIRERKDYDDISYRQWEYGREHKENLYDQFATSDITLPEHLLSQLEFSPLRHSCHKMGKYIIESLDENGYMTMNKKEIAQVFGVMESRVEEVIQVIHGFDPVGVGAIDLRECLLIQLEHMGEKDSLAAEIVEHHLEDIAVNRVNLIAKELKTTIYQVQEALDLIRNLEPKPGRQFACEVRTKYIIPDVIVEKDEDEYVVTLNETSSPRLVIGSYYEKLLTQSEEDPGLSKYLSGRINAATWLIRSIEQRKQTIYNVVSAVVKHQKDFFDHGSKHLKTLTLKEIAEEIGVHESTVSRSINGKYMQSSRGVFELKYFFSSGVFSECGASVSSESIKSFLKEIVGTEDSKSPYSDQEMVEILKDKGIEISRRTVAKYRDEAGIPSSSKRRRF